MFEPGSLIADKYRVLRVIGEGGMGLVVSATHLQLEQDVAIKMLLPDFRKSNEVFLRFQREAKAAARLRSNHVCRVLDVANLADGSPYIVMELLEGRDLGSVLETNGPLSVRHAVEYVLQACEALAEAHGIKLIHRDIKPANLFLTRGVNGADLIKVLDFGIAKVRDDGDVAQLTATMSIMGTPAYMSPEQLRSSRTVDERSDLWAIGVVLYQLISGRVPFQDASLTGLCLAITTDPHARIPHISPALQAVLDRCLEKDPAKRFSTISELAMALAPFRTGDQNVWLPHDRPTIAAPAAPPRHALSTLGGATGETIARPARRSTKIALAVCAGVVMSVVAIALINAGSRNSDQTSSAAMTASVQMSVVQPARGPANAPMPVPVPVPVPVPAPAAAEAATPKPAPVFATPKPAAEDRGAILTRARAAKTGPELEAARSALDGLHPDAEIHGVRAVVEIALNDLPAAAAEVEATPDIPQPERDLLRATVQRLLAARPGDLQLLRLARSLQLKQPVASTPPQAKERAAVVTSPEAKKEPSSPPVRPAAHVTIVDPFATATPSHPQPQQPTKIVPKPHPAAVSPDGIPDSR